MPESHETAFSLIATTHFEVNTTPPKFDFVDEPEPIVEIAKEARCEGTRRQGIPVAEFVNISCQSLDIEALIIARNEGYVGNPIGQTGKGRTIKAPTFQVRQPSTHGNVPGHDSLILHLKSVTIERHESKTF